MLLEVTNLIDPAISCSTCRAGCCKLEVMLLTDTGVPDAHISTDQWGAETMTRLDDGWCSALDRFSMLCTIYENRPWVCREVEMGSYECQIEHIQLL